MVQYTLPDQHDSSIGDVNLFTTFAHANYSTWASKRTRASVWERRNGSIVLPYPNNFNTLNNILYSNSPSIQIRAVENIMGTSVDPDVRQDSERRGFAGSFSRSKTSRSELKDANAGTIAKTLSNVGRLAAQNIIASGELFESFMTGGNVFRVDHTETVLKPGCRRTHVFEFTLIPKTPASAYQASEIALVFQAAAHPGSFTESIYTMNHPDLWIFGIAKKPYFADSYWDGWGLPSVLNRVDINRSPIQNIPYFINDTSGNRVPLAINIKLMFTELEPAFNYDGRELRNRSSKDFG
jgi:hypothetical protein